MTKKIRSAQRVRKLESVLKCPICESPVKVVDLKSLICSHNHTFDFAKQGYLNLMPYPTNSHYKKELFEARHKIITESDLYAAVHETITKAIRAHADVSINPFIIADLGCGEGSQLQKILDGCRSRTATGIGLDIAKEGIMMAAGRYESPIWLVADLAKTPLADRSVHVILNMLSPSNYKEFKRVLVQGGLVIKVVPRPLYLKELRDMLFEDDKKVYRNEETVSRFKNHFRPLDSFRLTYTQKLHNAELEHLVRMTPLAWTADQARIDAYINQETAEITVDVEVLIGLNM
jgi:Methyltransferase domain.